MAQKAFASVDSTKLLNKTIFPYITKLVEKEIIGDKVLLDAPTLFESGIDSLCDKTIAVLADRDIRLSRILARDNIAKDAALLRINAGKMDEFYKQRADYIIYNNSNEAEFVSSFSEIIKSI